jgi:hypothetical protein
MFWIGITVAVLLIFLATWIAARILQGGSDPPSGRDPEDRPIIPMPDDDGPFT